MNEDDKIYGLIPVYKDDEDGVPYITGTNDDGITYVTGLEDKYEYLNKYVVTEGFTIANDAADITTVGISKKTLYTRFVALLYAALILLAQFFIFHALQKSIILWMEYLDKHSIGGAIGMSMCSSLALFGFLVAGLIVLSFLNYAFGKDKNK